MILSQVTSIVLILLISYLSYLYYINEFLKYKITTLTYDNNRVKAIAEKNEVVDKQYQTLYREQTYNLPRFFLEDIYDKMSFDVMRSQLVNDYFGLFSDAVNTILSNKKEYQLHKKFYNINALQYPFNIPVLLYAKFTIDYNYYLIQIDPTTFANLVERYFPDFENDPKYFCRLDNRTVHISYFIEQAIKLYVKNTAEVNNCIYHRQCSV